MRTSPNLLEKAIAIALISFPSCCRGGVPRPGAPRSRLGSARLGWGERGGKLKNPPH